MYDASNDDAIYSFLLGPCETGQVYNSPLRDDKNPSFSLHEEDGVLKWKDFGLARGEVSGNKAINLLMEMRGISFKEALKVVKREILPSKRMGSLARVVRKRKAQVPYITWRNKYKSFELKYWNEFGITMDDLIYEKIYGLDNLRYYFSSDSGGYSVTSTHSDPAFVYWLNQSPAAWKIYRPKNPEYKFRMWNVDRVIEGWETFLEETRIGPVDFAIVSSSTKDRVCIKKALNDMSFSSINPPAEGIISYLISKKEEIDLHTLNMFVIFDADDRGYEMSKALEKETGWKAIDVRGMLGWDDNEDKPVKDFARHAELFGIQSLKEVLLNILEI